MQAYSDAAAREQLQHYKIAFADMDSFLQQNQAADLIRAGDACVRDVFLCQCDVLRLKVDKQSKTIFVHRVRPVLDVHIIATS